MRRRRLWIAAVAVVVLLGGAVWIGGDRWFGNSCDIPQAVAPGTSAGQGELRVMEQGFTQPVDEFDSVSLGAVVENSSDRIAYRTRVAVRLLDGQGREITGVEPAVDEIPIVMPGQRVGVGMTVSPVTAADLKVAAFEVGLQTSQWLAGDALGDGFGLVTAEYKRTVRRDSGVPQSTEIRFLPKSDACRPLVGANPATIFRDGNGTIVGGTRQYVVVTEACASSGRETWVIPRKAIPPADDSRTQLYPYCDVR